MTRGKVCLVTFRESLRIFSNVVGWSMVFCVCAARIATMSAWWHLAGSAEISAPAAVLAEWKRVPRSCWVRYFPKCPYASGF